MHAGSVAKVEKNVDRLASTLFAAACGYALNAWFAGRLGQPALAIESAVAVALAFLISGRALGAVQPRPRRLPVPIFDVREVGPIEEPELLLTEVFEPQPAAEPEDALVLDDILAKLSADSRVVRMFDPAAMPTAGELKSRIDRHLDDEASAAQTSDATQALHDALSELRRAIR
ncbi:MAG TPA: hypothetical protein VK192_01975 [Sphingomicrobium sp.]|jgi:hypothetical protein|nr:hypothetical protein [Sphingomicrobium sp.]